MVWKMLMLNSFNPRCPESSRCSRDEFDHILGTFPLVFPDDEAGQQRREHVLAVYDEWADTVSGWATT
jgi:hypothetical protein